MAIIYTTWNPDDKSANITLSDGNLTAETSSGGWNNVRSVLSVTTGKHYFEYTITDVSNVQVGIVTSVTNYTRYFGGDAYSVGWQLQGEFYIGALFTGNGKTPVSLGNGDIACIALDMDAGKIWFGKNGAWIGSGDPAAGTDWTFSFTPGAELYAAVGVSSSIITANFGASAFSHSVPSGFNSGFYSVPAVEFTFTDPTPVHLSTVYGTTEQICLTTTASGAEPNYVYDATFYDELDIQIGTTVSGIQSGQPAESNEYLSTPSGIDYSWYMTATSSGVEDTSDTYTFHNRFLASGTTEVNGVLTSGIDVRLYSRDTGELVGSSVSTISGVFDIETQCNTESYCVALSPYTDTNSLIYDFLEPGD